MNFGGLEASRCCVTVTMRGTSIAVFPFPVSATFSANLPPSHSCRSQPRDVNSRQSPGPRRLAIAAADSTDKLLQVGLVGFVGLLQDSELRSKCGGTGAEFARSSVVRFLGTMPWGRGWSELTSIFLYIFPRLLYLPTLLIACSWMLHYSFN